jgi:hypothetical protein
MPAVSGGLAGGRGASNHKTHVLPQEPVAPTKHCALLSCARRPDHILHAQLLQQAPHSSELGNSLHVVCCPLRVYMCRHDLDLLVELNPSGFTRADFDCSRDECLDCIAKQLCSPPAQPAVETAVQSPVDRAVQPAIPGPSDSQFDEAAGQQQGAASNSSSHTAAATADVVVMSRSGWQVLHHRNNWLRLVHPVLQLQLDVQVSSSCRHRFAAVVVTVTQVWGLRSLLCSRPCDKACADSHKLFCKPKLRFSKRLRSTHSSFLALIVPWGVCAAGVPVLTRWLPGWAAFSVLWWRPRAQEAAAAADDCTGQAGGWSGSRASA